MNLIRPSVTNDDPFVVTAAVDETSQKVRPISGVQIYKHNWVSALEGGESNKNQTPDKMVIRWTASGEWGNRESTATYGSPDSDHYRRTEKTYSGCTNASMAARLGSHHLRTALIQPYHWTGVADGSAADLEPGDVFQISDDVLTSTTVRLLPPKGVLTNGAYQLSMREFDIGVYTDVTASRPRGESSRSRGWCRAAPLRPGAAPCARRGSARTRGGAVRTRANHRRPAFPVARTRPRRWAPARPRSVGCWRAAVTEPVARAKSQGVWLVVSPVATRAIQFLSTIALARLLVPEDFGKVAIAAVAWEVVALFGNTGVAATIIQRRDRVDELCAAAFWLNAAASAAVAVASAAIAIPVARFYGEPAVAPIMALYALGFVVSSAGTINSVLLTREVAFGPNGDCGWWCRNSGVMT